MVDVSISLLEMWMFRFVALLMVFFMLLIGGTNIWKTRVQWRKLGWAAYRDQSTFANVIIICGSLFIASVAFLVTSYRLSEIHTIWHFKVDSVSRLEVYRMSGYSYPDTDLTPQNVRLSIDDPMVIRTFFDRLRWAPYRGTSHESFSDGYMIRIVPIGDEQPELFISVCRVSSKGPSVAIFSPQVDLITATAIGHYSSPSLLLWLESSLAAGKPVEFPSE